jgi:mRNA interferase RelE/StbE
MSNPALNRFYKKLNQYVYPQLKKLPHYGPNIKKLKGDDFEDIYRYRIGDYRLLYMIDELNQLVIILDFAHRKHVYH